MKILIPTMPNDIHAIFVHLALRELGHEGVLWYTADFPCQQQHTFEFDKTYIQWMAKGFDLDIRNDSFEVVWLRRPKEPILSDQLHEDDKDNVFVENMAFYQTLWHMVAPEAFWINKRANARKANCKALQLKTAQNTGMSLPNTIISNNPERIKEFIEQNAKQGVVYKSLFPMAWTDGAAPRLAYAMPVELTDLPSDDILQSTVGIFQEKIEKAFELRVTYMGDQGIAVKIDSQQHPQGRFDWRAIPITELALERYILPPSIDRGCRLIMKELGIVFGCFDFIVTPEGDFQFLEVNEQGQFLWIEELNPEIKLLDAFANFLMSRSPSFQWNERAAKLSSAYFREEAVALNDKMRERHLDDKRG